jgi:SAM-dependent methyltransferase
MTSTSPGPQDAPSTSDRWRADTSVAEQEQLKGYLHSVFASPFLQNVAAQTMSLLRLEPGESVLEVGCGTGVFLPLLAREVGSSGRVVGVDHSASMVHDARQGAAGGVHNIEIRQADALELPFESATFDAVHCERVLMHVEDADRAISEMVRVTKPGGRIVAAEPDWPGIRIDHPQRREFDMLYARSLRHTHGDMGLTLVRRFARAGLTHVEASPVVGVFRQKAILETYGLDLAFGAKELDESGVLPAARSEELIATLNDLDREGHYFAAALFHLVIGRVPK